MTHMQEPEPEERQRSASSGMHIGFSPDTSMRTAAGAPTMPPCHLARHTPHTGRSQAGQSWGQPGSSSPACSSSKMPHPGWGHQKRPQSSAGTRHCASSCDAGREVVCVFGGGGGRCACHTRGWATHSEMRAEGWQLGAASGQWQEPSQQGPHLVQLRLCLGAQHQAGACAGHGRATPGLRAAQGQALVSHAVRERAAQTAGAEDVAAGACGRAQRRQAACRLGECGRWCQASTAVRATIAPAALDIPESARAHPVVQPA